MGLAALGLALLTLAVYAPAFRSDFVAYDDPLYVTENDWVQQGLTAASVRLAWTEYVAGNWHPITMLSHLADVSLFGLDPRGHHATSLLLHTANTLLLFGLLRSLFGGVLRPALAAALFALHPFNVDSAVWIAERKNVLSTLFWLAGTACYVRYSRRASVPALLGTLACFALGLMSKPMLVTFPLTLLMLDVWPLGRVQGCSRATWPTWSSLLMEKIPLFLLTAAFSVATVITQFPKGYVHSTMEVAWWMRPLFALEHYRMYLQKFFWPDHFSVFYPHLPLPPQATTVILSALLLAFLTAGAVASARRAPAWLFGWLWFLGTLFPVVGIIGIGQHSIADRYMYVPMIGLLIALVWSWPDDLPRTVRRLLGLAGLLALMACALRTRAQLPFWQNSEALFAHALAVTERNHVMLSNLARVRILQGQTEEANRMLDEALALDPHHVGALVNRGFALSRSGQPAEALPFFETAVELNPNHEAARRNLAVCLDQLGQKELALRQYQILLRLKPRDPKLQAAAQELRARMGLRSTW
jgi:tetratricopeptide (TPR) repeat protein